MNDSTEILSTGGDFEPLWNASNKEIRYWEKAHVTLPRDIGRYQLLFVGEYSGYASYYSRNMVLLDDIDFKMVSIAIVICMKPS